MSPSRHMVWLSNYLTVTSNGRPARGGDVTTDETESPILSASAFAFLQKLVITQIGVELPGKDYLVANRLEPLVRQHQLTDSQELIERIQGGDRTLRTAVVEAMTTNETSFFRDSHPFDALINDVLPTVLELKRSKSLTIWNGACSSGQESYSLAIAIREHLTGLVNPADVTIVSTDVSADMVERTNEGSYSRFEINRGLSSALAQKYFDQEGRSWVAKPLLRDMVKASQLNLLDPWPDIPRCDVVILRNVLIYFPLPTKQTILRRVRTRVLEPHGCLLLGATESLYNVDCRFRERRVGRTALHYIDGTTLNPVIGKRQAS